MSAPADQPARGAVRLLGLLLVKDLRRARRNPVPFLVHLAVPLLITALIGMAFGGAGGGAGKGLGRIQLAIVDEDDSLLSRLLRGSLNQQRGSEHVEARFLDRAAALREVSADRLSAAIIVPAGFTRGYVSGQGPLTLELVKNPARTLHPAVVEEVLALLTAGLNAVARNLGDDLAAWSALVDRDREPTAVEMGELVTQTGRKLEGLRKGMQHSFVWYEREGGKQETATSGSDGPRPNVFGYLLPGLTAMFLLFIADTALRDLYREERFRTLARYRTLPTSMLALVAAKALFAVSILLMSGAILFGGGVVIFGIRWAHPLLVALLLAAYAWFAAGFMALVTALSGTERRADTLNTIVAMALGLAGGCAFPRDQLPGFLRDHVTAWMPTDWFTMAVRGLQGMGGGVSWSLAATGLLVLGTAFMALAAWWLQRRLEKGGAA